MANTFQKVSIIGYGYVGKGMAKVFPDAIIYDPYVPEATGTKEEVNKTLEEEDKIRRRIRIY